MNETMTTTTTLKDAFSKIAVLWLVNAFVLACVIWVGAYYLYGCNVTWIETPRMLSIIGLVISKIVLTIILIFSFVGKYPQ